MEPLNRRSVLAATLVAGALSASAQAAAPPEKPVTAPTIPGPDPRTKTPARCFGFRG